MRYLVLLLAILAFVPLSCAKLGSGYTTAPGVMVEQTFLLSAHVAAEATGDTVLIGGSFVKSWTREQPDTLEFFGTIVGTDITGLYTRPVWAVDEDYTVVLWHKASDGLHRIMDALVVQTTSSTTTITALVSNSYTYLWKFQVGRDDGGNVIVNPIRDDRPNLVGGQLWTNGIASTNPDSLFLNDPLTATTPVRAYSPWSGMRPLSCEWAPTNSWMQAVELVKPGRQYFRFERENGSVVLAGCHYTGVRNTIPLNHVVNGGGTKPWWVFAIDILDDGTAVNAGPPNLPLLISVGS
ncbi:MAG: hypothetical protein V1778_03290 [bacterium]